MTVQHTSTSLKTLKNKNRVHRQTGLKGYIVSQIYTTFNLLINAAEDITSFNLTWSRSIKLLLLIMVD